MSFVSVDVKTRPIKIAFLVDFNDKTALHTAISINSVLWGGKYNPIIPVYKKLPKNFSDSVMRKFITSEIVTNGYIEACDADFIVNLSSRADNSFPIGRWRFIKEKNIFDNSVRRRKAKARAEVNYGIGLFEVFDYLEEHEFKYVRNVPLVITHLVLGSKHGLFLGSVFGSYSLNTREHLQKRYAETIKVQEQNVALSNYLDIWQQNDLTTIRMACNFYLDVYGQNGHTQDYIFLMDANSWQDNVDLINLRTSGLNVFPLPLQLCMTDQANKLASDFITEHYRKFNQNNVFYETTILKSRDCSEAQFNQFVESLKIDRKQGEVQFVLQTSHPRIWDSWARSRDGGVAARLEHKSAPHQVEDTSRVRVSQLRPDLLDEDHYWRKPKYANEVSLQTYGANDYMANVFPVDIERADMVLGKLDPDGWRFSREGIVYLPSRRRDMIDFNIPSAEDVYSEWQKTHGINAGISGPGKLARQIVKKLGVDHLRLLAHEDFAKTLQSLTNAKGAVLSIKYDDLWSKIQRLTNDTMWHDAEGFFGWILAKKIFELGAEVECKNCGRHPWYSLKELDEAVVCRICLGRIEISLNNPKKLKWAYRPTGPFTVPDLAQGAYTVVLAFHLFAEVLHLKITPRYSFASSDDKYEADFGILVKQQWHEGDGNIQLIGECKSFGLQDNNRPQFKDEELNKLVKLGKTHKNSVIVFATLRRELTIPDKKKLKKLVEQLRKDRFKNSDIPEVLILTGNELFTEHSLGDSWEKLSEKHKDFSKNVGHSTIRELCDLTQQLYLGLGSWWDWWDHKRKSLEVSKTKKDSLISHHLLDTSL